MPSSDPAQNKTAKLSAEDHLFRLGIVIGFDGGSFLDPAREDLHRQRVLQFPLQGPLQRSRAVDRVLAGLGQVFLGPLGKLDG